MNAIRLLKLTTTLFAAVAAASAANPARAQATVPLVAFYSPSAGDFFTTSQPAWTCRLHGCSGEFGDYQLYGMQGHVFNPDLPQPAGTLPLWHWFSEAREDNLLTTHPDWNPAAGHTRESGETYQFVRLAGYIRPVGPPAYLQLRNFWKEGDRDNAALTTARFITTGGGTRIPMRVPPGYGEARVEGVLLPPESAALGACNSSQPATGGDRTSWQARGNYIETWTSPNGFFHGDVLKVTAPEDIYRIDFWGNHKPVRGDGSYASEPGYPAVGIQRFALLGRVTGGRAFVQGQGWFEANQWFRALGEHYDWPGNCILYDAAGMPPATFQLGFNDPTISDNGGWANVTIRQWWQ